MQLKYLEPEELELQRLVRDSTNIIRLIHHILIEVV